MDEATSPKHAMYHLDHSSAQASFKRRRTALACNSCRTRKTRCNGERPSCVPCIELGLECIYENPANNNGRYQQPTYEDRLKSIEDALQLLVNSRSQLPHDISRYADTTPPFETSASHAIQSGERAVRLQPEVSEDDVDNEDADGMASLNPSDSETRFYGPSSNIAFLRHLSEATAATFKNIEGESLTSDVRAAQTLVSRVPSPINTPSTTGPGEKQQPNALALPTEPHTSRLIELFFNETGLLFPFIQKDYVISTYNHARSRGMTGIRKTFLCLVHSILAMAAHIDGDAKTNAEAETYYQRAHTIAFQTDFRQTNVEIVQSLLIMIQYRQGTQKSDDTWVLLGRAVRIASQLGLHSRETTLNLSPVEMEVRKRVWYNCIILDRVLSMTFGRPQTISKEYVRLDLPLNRDLDFLAVPYHTPTGRTSTQPAETVCFFIATIQLYNVLDYILATIYDHNLSIGSETPLSEVLKHGLAVEQKLLDWQNELPSALKRRPWFEDLQQSPTESSVFDKLSAIIHLRYLNVSLLHHRAILDRFLDSLHTKDVELPISETQDSFFLDFARHSLKVSQNAAMEIVDVVWKMSHRSAALGAWWFSAYYTFNASLVMYGCILVLFSFSKQSHHQSTITTQSDRQYKIEEMIGSLNTAVKAIERVGKGTRTAKGIRRTLIKIIQISRRLAQLHAAVGVTPGQINGAHDSGIVQTDSMAYQALNQQNPNLAEVAYDESCQTAVQFAGQWEVPDIQYWTTQNALNIFGDLGSLDAGMGSFMAA